MSRRGPRLRSAYRSGRSTQTGGRMWSVPADAVRAFIHHRGLTATADDVRAWLPTAAGWSHDDFDVELEEEAPLVAIGYHAAQQGWAVPCNACGGCVRQLCGLAERERVVGCAVCGGAGAVASEPVREAV